MNDQKGQIGPKKQMATMTKLPRLAKTGKMTKLAQIAEMNKMARVATTVEMTKMAKWPIWPE